jgi:50S ribosomal subunit-associated GTPase HflX
VPKILYIANKAEDGHEGDLLGDFFMKFPYAAEDEDCEPIFISAEHGDGFTDLYAAIQNEIPGHLSSQYVSRKEKRLSRYNDLKESMMDDIVDLKLDLMEKQAASETK